jgi:diguanylate cyclase (GGDEF)-like protein
MRMRKYTIFILGLFSTIFIGWIDYITGPYLVLSLFYLFPGFYFYEILNLEMERARRHNNHFSIAYIDLDNFKDINDKYGHLVGDELLHRIAILIKQNIRNIDTVARLGGDEFVVLMPETPTIKGRAVIERLIKIFLGEMAKNDWPVTMSAGLASFLQIPTTVDAIISKADELMYVAKQKGKNRIEEKIFD